MAGMSLCIEKERGNISISLLLFLSCVIRTHTSWQKEATRSVVIPKMTQESFRRSGQIAKTHTKSLLNLAQRQRRAADGFLYSTVSFDVLYSNTVITVTCYSTPVVKAIKLYKL